MAQLEKPYPKVPKPDNTKVHIIIVHGELRDIKADAIVFPANRNLTPGTGLNEALFKASNPTGIDRLSMQLEKYDAPLNVNDAVVTDAFSLKADIAVHVLAPEYSGEDDRAHVALEQTYVSALLQADAHDAESIAFPLLGTAEFQYPEDMAADIALNTVHHPKHITFRNINTAFFAVSDPHLFEYMKDHLKQLMYQKRVTIPVPGPPSRSSTPEAEDHFDINTPPFDNMY